MEQCSSAGLAARELKGSASYSGSHVSFVGAGISKCSSLCLLKMHLTHNPSPQLQMKELFQKTILLHDFGGLAWGTDDHFNNVQRNKQDSIHILSIPGSTNEHYPESPRITGYLFWFTWYPMWGSFKYFMDKVRLSPESEVVANRSWSKCLSGAAPFIFPLSLPIFEPVLKIHLKRLCLSSTGCLWKSWESTAICPWNECKSGF